MAVVAYEFDFDFGHGPGFDAYVERTDRDQLATYAARDVCCIDDDDAGAEEVRSAHTDRFELE